MIGNFLITGSLLYAGVNGPIHITMTATLRLVDISVSATFLISKAEWSVLHSYCYKIICLPGAKGIVSLLSPYSSKAAGSLRYLNFVCRYM